MPSSRFIFGTLPYYSVLIVLGMVLAIVLASREEKRLGLPKDTVVDLALFLIPVSILCARLYYVLFAWDAFRDHPLSILAIWEGGIAIYGGLIGGVLTVLLFSRIRRLHPLTLMDILVPGVALAQAIGRWGNFFNMEAYGLPVPQQALQFFPFAVQIPEGSGLVWHLATFFYESCWDLLIFLLLWLLRKKSQRRGTLFLLYSLLYAAGRLVIEGLRTDSLMAGNLRISQMLAAVICIAILAWMIVRSRLASPGIRFWILLALQVLLFFVLPYPETENALFPCLFLFLASIFPFIQLSALHSRFVKTLSLGLCGIIWTAYVLLAHQGSFAFSVLYAAAALLLGSVVFYPAFHPDTEVDHADHTDA